MSLTLLRASVIPFLLTACSPLSLDQQAYPVAESARPAFPDDAALQRMLADRMRANGVGEVVGLIDASGTRVISYGHAGDNGSRPLDGDTIFQIGSVTKGLTTLLLADMVHRGEVSLDQPVQELLPPGVVLHKVGRPITLRDLATHRSGLPAMPDNFDLSAKPDPYESYTVDQLYAFLSHFVPEHAPGTEARYSNLGVSLLGRVLARRAGTDYATLLKKRILDPLAMSSSAITPEPGWQNRIAQGHDRYLRPVRTWEMRVMPASGSLRSTANDMLKLVAAYIGERDTSLKPAMDLQLGERIATRRGWQALGWGIRADGIVTHSGGKQGYRSAVAFDPVAKRGVVVLANARTYDEPMALALHLLAAEPIEPAPAAPPQLPIIHPETDLLDRYAGWYCLDSGEPIEVARKNFHLLVHTPGAGISEFFATAPNAFFLDTGNDELAFRVAGSQPAEGIMHYPDGAAKPPVPGVRVQGRDAALACRKNAVARLLP
jgi:D-alanyl-D-alanine-carboxypeptidase/D-alanyl-D-alanine-endopeptidase